MRRERPDGVRYRIGQDDAPQDVLSRVLVAAAVVGWVVVVALGGGHDIGRPGVGDGPAGLLLAVTGASLVAAVALLVRPGRLSGVTWTGMGAMAAYVAWSAMSILWAPGPDLAWLSTNRMAAALSAGVIGVGLARVLRDPMATFAKALAVAAGVVVAPALASRIVPTLLAPTVEPPRLAWGIGAPNALALVAVLALPGAALALASERAVVRIAARSAITGSLLVIAMTQSRTGLISLVLMLVLVATLMPHRPRTIAAIAAAVVAVVPPVIFAYTNPAFTRESVLAPAGTRVAEGLVFGVLVLAALVSAVVLAPAPEVVMVRLDRAVLASHGRRRAVVLAGVAVVAAGAVALVMRGAPVGGGADRLVSVDSNNRTEWWRQAWAAFREQPVAGHGAGSFPYIHLSQRTADIPALQARDPHQLVLGVASELGLVGLALLAVVLAATGVAVRRLGVRRTAPALSVLVVVLVHSQLDETWAIPAASMVAAAAAGVILGRMPSVPAADVPRRRVMIGAAAVPVVAALWVSAIVYWSGQSLVQRAIEKGDRGDWVASRDLARRAAERNPLSIQGLLQEALARHELHDATGAARVAAAATGRQPDSPLAWSCRAALTTGAAQRAAKAEIRRLSPAWDFSVSKVGCNSGW